MHVLHASAKDTTSTHVLSTECNNRWGRFKTTKQFRRTHRT